MFKTQPKLLSVNLTNNLIQSIQKGAFLNMTRLVRLILTKNKISNLQDEVLSGEIRRKWKIANLCPFKLIWMAQTIY